MSRLNRSLIIICIMSLALPIFKLGSVAHAERSTAPCICNAPDGRQIFAEYDGVNAQLMVVNSAAYEILQILESGLSTNAFEARGWSSDCRYLVATVGAWGQQETIAWDVVENRRVGSIQTKGQLDTDLAWVPTNDYRLLVQSLAGAYLWHLSSNTQLLLNPYSNEWGRNFWRGSSEVARPRGRIKRDIYWDLARNQLMAVPVDPNRDGVAAYDLATGQEVAFYPLNPTPREVHFRPFDGGNHLLVFAYDEPVGTNSQLIMFNRDTQANMALSPTILSGVNPTAFFSTSRRYLMIRTWWISVYDLQTLSGPAPYAPNIKLDIFVASYIAQYIRGYRLNADETIVQAVAYWYGLDFTIWQWDLATGERYYVKKFDIGVCDDYSLLDAEDDVAMIEWACGYR